MITVPDMQIGITELTQSVFAFHTVAGVREQNLKILKPLKLLSVLAPCTNLWKKSVDKKVFCVKDGEEIHLESSIKLLLAVLSLRMTKHTVHRDIHFNSQLPTKHVRAFS